MSVIVSDRRTLIVGLGKTGLSCVRYLSEQGRDVAVADSRTAPPGLDQLKVGWPDIPVHLGTFDAELFAGFNELVVSPGISVADPAIAAAREAGAMILGTLIDELQRRDQKRGLATLCVGGGMGIATIVEIV
mgnify:CR=1 FL=1